MDYSSILEPDPLCAPDAAGNWQSNEFDTGRRLGWEYAKRLRWCQSLNQWIVYKGGCWKKEGLEESKAAAMAICTAQIVANQGNGVRTASYIKNVLTQAKRWLAIDSECFDNSALLLCCADGVLSLYKENCGMLLDHAPEYLMTLSTGVSLQQYCDDKGVVRLPKDWGYGFYHWENHLLYLSQNLGEEEGLEFRQFFQRWNGTVLLGSQDEKPHHFLNLRGKGRNGKSLAASARIKALGDYGYQGPQRLLTRKENEHSTELAGCMGKRLIIVEEVNLIQAASIKDMSGGGFATARRMRQDDVCFPKSWTMEILTNGPLNLAGESSVAMQKRKIVANLGDQIPDRNHRDGVANELKAESALILAWMVDGLRRWREEGSSSRGLAIPGWMLENSNQESEDDDILASLITERYERCSPDECHILGSSFVKEANERRKNSGFTMLTPAAIFAYLRDQGFIVKPGRGNKTMIYGLRFQNLEFGEIMENARTGADWN